MNPLPLINYFEGITAYRQPNYPDYWITLHFVNNDWPLNSDEITLHNSLN